MEVTKKIKKVSNAKPKDGKKTQKEIDEKYQKKTERERVLLRPGMYIGTVQNTTEETWVYNSDTNKMENKIISYNPGILKLFDEIITNASDHSRDHPKKVTKIDVEVDTDAGSISISNDGPGIDIEIHSVHKCYIPELIFANLGSGTNYNDDEKRLKGGMNGLGSKIVGTFSKIFTVETVSRGKKYTQTYKDNLVNIGKPVITSSKKKEGTKIIFFPDLKRFGLNKLSDQMVKVFEKRTLDIGACTEKTVSVSFNGKKLGVKDFEAYIDLYCGSKKESPRVILD
jgi:DNA topoisomerase-2